MVRGQFTVDLGAGLAELERGVAAVILGHFLLHDIGIDRHGQVVGLTGQVRRNVIVLVGLESRIAQIGPEDCRHAQIVRMFERFGYFLYLAARMLGAIKHRRPHRHRTHVERLIHTGEQGLVEFIGIGQQFVVVDFYDERNPVRVLARHRTEHAQRGGNTVATALDGKLNNTFRIEINRVWRK